MVFLSTFLVVWYACVLPCASHKKEECRKDVLRKFLKKELNELAEQEFVEPENTSCF